MELGMRIVLYSWVYRRFFSCLCYTASNFVRVQ